MRFTKNALILPVVLLLGLFLRINGLSDESIWLDEGISLSLVRENPFSIIITTARDVHPPLYYLILRCWTSLLGISVISTRFLSAIFGFLAVWVIYKIGSLISDKETGILSALILALSGFHIYYSQEIRMYSMVALLSLFSMYFL